MLTELRSLGQAEVLGRMHRLEGPMVAPKGMTLDLGGMLHVRLCNPSLRWLCHGSGGECARKSRTGDQGGGNEGGCDFPKH